MDKQSMVEFIIRNADASADQSAIASYYQKKTEAEVAEDFQKLLIGEKQRIAASNEDLKKAETAAAEAIQSRNQAYSDYIWLSICSRPIKHVSPRYNGKQVQNVTSSRIEVLSWPHDGEKPSWEWFQHVMDEQPFLADRLAWQDYLSPKAEQQNNAQVEEATRATFFSVAPAYDLSRCESNVQAVVQHFPDGADSFQIGLAIQNHELNLAPCNKAEYTEYTRELEAEFTRKWNGLPIHEVRKRSQECATEREALLARHSWKERGVLTKEDEEAARQESIRVQESALGYAVMPASIGETTLDASYLKGCSRNQLMDAIRRWGSYQVNQRLVGK